MRPVAARSAARGTSAAVEANGCRRGRLSGRFRKRDDLSGRKLKEIAVSGRSCKPRGAESPRFLRFRPDRHTDLQNRPDTPFQVMPREPRSPGGRRRAGCRRPLRACRSGTVLVARMCPVIGAPCLAGNGYGPHSCDPLRRAAPRGSTSRGAPSRPPAGLAGSTGGAPGAPRARRPTGRSPFAGPESAAPGRAPRCAREPALGAPGAPGLARRARVGREGAPRSRDGPRDQGQVLSERGRSAPVES